MGRKIQERQLSKGHLFLTGAALFALAAGGLSAGYAAHTISPEKQKTAKKAVRKTAPEIYSSAEPGVISYAVADGEAIPIAPEAPLPIISERAPTPDALDFAPPSESSEALPPPPAPIAAGPAVTQTSSPRQAPKSVAAAPLVATQKKLPFDPVPINQVDSIARRLKLVEVLLRKYNRAYDYRTLTLHELESILIDLDTADSTTL